MRITLSTFVEKIVLQLISNGITRFVDIYIYIYNEWFFSTTEIIIQN